MISKNRKEKKKISSRTIGFICVALAIIICSVFFVFFSNESNNKYNKGLDDIYSKNTEEIIIETEYCDLKYPKKWEEYLKTIVEEGKHGVIVNFYCKISDSEEQLVFSVFLGESGEIPVGYLSVDDVNIDVCVSYGEVDNSELNDNDFKLITSMQEDLNYTIMQLAKKKNFEMYKEY